MVPRWPRQLLSNWPQASANVGLILDVYTEVAKLGTRLGKCTMSNGIPLGACGPPNRLAASNRFPISGLQVGAGRSIYRSHARYSGLAIHDWPMRRVS